MGSKKADGLDNRLRGFRDGTDRTSAFDLATQLFEAGRWDDALEVTNAKTGNVLDNATLTMLRGRALLKLRRLDEAQSAFLNVARQHPQSPDGFRWLAEALLERADLGRATRTIQHARQLAPTDADIAELEIRIRHAVVMAGGDPAQVTDQHPEIIDDEGPGSQEHTAVRPDLAAKFAALMSDVETGQVYNEANRLTAPHDDVPTNVFPSATDAPPRPGPRGRPGPHAATTSPPRPPPRPQALAPLPEDLAEPPSLPTLALEQSSSSPPTARGVTPEVLAALTDGMLASEPPTQYDAKLPLGISFAPPPAVDSDYPTAGLGPDLTATDYPTVSAGPQALALSAALAKANSGMSSLDSLATAALRQPDARESSARSHPEPEEGNTATESVELSTDSLIAHAAEVMLHGENVVLGIEMLEGNHLFEPTGSGAAAWDSPATDEAQAHWPTLAILWAAALAVAAGGAIALSWHIRRERSEAAALIAEAQRYNQDQSLPDVAKIRNLLDRAVSLDPHNPAVRREWLLTLGLDVAAGERGSLRALAFALDPARRQGVPEVDVTAGEAALAMARGRRSEARTLALTVPADPGAVDGRALAIAGRVLLSVGELAPATLRLEAALMTSTRSADIAVALAERFQAEGDTAKALAVLERITRRIPDEPHAVLWRALLEGAPRDSAGIARVLKDVEPKLQPADRTGHVLAGILRSDAYASDKRRDAALRELEMIAGRARTSASLAFLIAKRALDLGALNLAEDLANVAAAPPSDAAERQVLLAEVRYARSDHIGAIAALKNVAPSDPTRRLIQCRASLALGTPDLLRQTNELLAESSDTDPTSMAVEACRLQLRARVAPTQTVLTAARTLERAHPKSPAAALAVAEAAASLGQYSLALRSIPTALANVDPASRLRALLIGGISAERTGDADRAVDYLRQASEAPYSSTEASTGLARIAFARGAWAESAAAIEALLLTPSATSNPEVAQRYAVQWARALAELGRYADAERALNGIRPKPSEDDPEIASTRATIALRQNQPGLAVDLAKRAVGAAKRPSAALLILYADALVANGQSHDAEPRYKAALSIDRDAPGALHGLGELSARSGDQRMAIQWFARAVTAYSKRLSADADRARAWYSLGRAQLSLGKRGLATAIQSLRRATTLKDAPAESFYWLGEAVAKTSPAEARNAWKRYLELVPEGELAQKARRSLRTD